MLWQFYKLQIAAANWSYSRRRLFDATKSGRRLTIVLRKILFFQPEQQHPIEAHFIPGNEIVAFRHEQ
jgi:hypothetical protein